MESLNYLISVGRHTRRCIKGRLSAGRQIMCRLRQFKDHPMMNELIFGHQECCYMSSHQEKLHLRLEIRTSPMIKSSTVSVDTHTISQTSWLTCCEKYQIKTQQIDQTQNKSSNMNGSRSTKQRAGSSPNRYGLPGIIYDFSFNIQYF